MRLPFILFCAVLVVGSWVTLRAQQAATEQGIVSSGGAARTSSAPQSSAAKKTGTPAKTIVRDGGTSEPNVEIQPSVLSPKVSQEIQTTDQLLASTNTNVKVLANRQLTSAQSDELSEIKAYISQAKTAATNGDAERAYNLAHKANLLSSDLLKQ